MELLAKLYTITCIRDGKKYKLTWEQLQKFVGGSKLRIKYEDELRDMVSKLVDKNGKPRTEKHKKNMLEIHLFFRILLQLFTGVDADKQIKGNW